MKASRELPLLIRTLVLYMSHMMQYLTVGGLGLQSRSQDGLGMGRRGKRGRLAGRRGGSLGKQRSVGKREDAFWEWERRVVSGDSMLGQHVGKGLRQVGT